MENSKESGKKKVADEELENVVGGTCYAKGKGVIDPYLNQQRRYAIVSPLNICPIYSGNLNCAFCGSSFRIRLKWYCAERWWENDHEVRRYSKR